MTKRPKTCPIALLAPHWTTLCLASPFASQYAIDHPQVATMLSDMHRPLVFQDFEALWLNFDNNSLNDKHGDNNHANENYTYDDINFNAKLRKFRNAVMVRFIYQEVANILSLGDIVAQLSVFADFMINLAKNHHYQGNDLAIIAMGKLGAKELNLSSDIDLVFVQFGNESNHIAKYARKIVQSLANIQENGFVFRVDMRLRPWGEGSALVISLHQLDRYFQSHGRTWERFAWLKARVVNAIDGKFLHKLQQTVYAFVYRYYIDYSAYAALREMKQLISQQINQRQDSKNIKLSAGGIRDIEFIVQSFLLIYGAHYPRLGQNLSTMTAIVRLRRYQFLDKKTAYDLMSAYRFLRKIEHLLQAYADRQTQHLPDDIDMQKALALCMGFDNFAMLVQRLEYHRACVIAPFDALVGARTTVSKSKLTIDEVLEKLDEPAKNRLISFIRHSEKLGKDARARLQAVYPKLAQALIDYPHDPNALILPLVRVLEAICRRSIYLVMLAENANAFADLLPILAKSPLIGEEIIHHPVLLDTFLQKRHLNPPNQSALQEILREQILRVEIGDDERLMSAVRLFKKTQMLTVAMGDILDDYPIMKVSDTLTFTAETVVQACLVRAFLQLLHKHGAPRLNTGERANESAMGIAIIGYGKLGGLELSYASDLDLVFLHTLDEHTMTDGQEPISGMRFAQRVVQKVMALLTTTTRDGRAYAIDTRLRPSGAAGVMVASLSHFEQYQMHKAWAWEHQAMVRARGICGDGVIMDAFERTRRAVLCMPRNIDKLRVDVLNMRTKISSHKKLDAHAFHLKHGDGGLIDIEFMAQYAVLGLSHQYPNLAIWSDNIRIFESLQSIWGSEICLRLSKHYLALRACIHTAQLLGQVPSYSDKKLYQIQRAVIDDKAWVFSHGLDCL